MRSRHFITLSLFILLVAACGDGEPTPTTSESPATPTTAGSPATPETTTTQPSQPAPGSGSGYVEVNGVRYEMDEVLRCDDLDAELDLIATGSGVTAFVIIEDWGGLITHEFSIQGSVGLYDGSAYDFGEGWRDEFDELLPGPPFVVDGNRVRGEITILEFQGPGTADIVFDLEFPATARPC